MLHMVRDLYLSCRRIGSEPRIRSNDSGSTSRNPARSFADAGGGRD